MHITEEFNVLEKIIKERRSHRRMSEELIDEHLVGKILESAIWAPSSCNMQLLGLIRITDKGLKAKLVKEAKSHHLIEKAPVVFLVTYVME